MCPLCLTWKFPQEMGRAKWCCRGGELIDVIAPWTQPTPEFRALCLDSSGAVIEFRASSRKYNNEVSFGSYGINYGAAKTLPVPSFFNNKWPHILSCSIRRGRRATKILHLRPNVHSRHAIETRDTQNSSRVHRGKEQPRKSFETIWRSFRYRATHRVH